ncbi:Stress response protein nst1 [Coemansia biformis]|uniref:Stress response protein NST1 n=1 Tax=Coemansia biformis TaxID=1286918 RepID=A0A9W7YBX0_9FUNG|nr:Stress response protein nst1 [Coemansia biformis]
MALEMTSSPGHMPASLAKGTAALDGDGLSNAQEPPAVFGPQPPPSMMQGAVDASELAEGLSVFTVGPRADRDSDDPIECRLRSLEAELREAIRLQLEVVMAEHGYDCTQIPRKGIADILYKIGLLKSPTDDIMPTIGRLIQTRVYKYLQRRLGSTGVVLTPEQLARKAAGPSPCRIYFDPSQASLETDDDGDDAASSLVCTERVMQIMHNYVLTKALANSGAKVVQAAAEPDKPDAAEPGGEEGSRKTRKKKKSKKKSKAKAVAAADAIAADNDDCDYDNDNVLAPVHTGSEQLPPRQQQQRQPQQPQQHAPPRVSGGLPSTPARVVARVASRSSTAAAGVPTSVPAGADLAPRRTTPSKPPYDGYNYGYGYGDGAGYGDGYGDCAAEYWQIREFWLTLSDVERQALVMVEKEVVLARVRDQQNFSCGCNVCTRKREAIEHELDSLYENYYEVLKRNARRVNLRLWIASARKEAQSAVLKTVEALTEMVLNKMQGQPEAETRKRVQETIIECMEQSPDAKVLFGPELHKLSELESALQRASLVDADEDPADADEGPATAAGPEPHASDASSLLLRDKLSRSLKVRLFGEEDARGSSLELPEFEDGSMDSRQYLGKLFQMAEEDTNESLTNGDLFYTEEMLDTIDTFPADSKKFFDMMERLAEYRMRREDAMLGELGGDDVELDADMAGDIPADDDSALLDPEATRSRRLRQLQRRCPDCHGEIGETEGQQAYPDINDGPDDEFRSNKRARADLGAEYLDDGDVYGVDDGYDVDDGYGEDEDDIDDTDDDFDDLDPESAEREIESGRKVFQLFAARLFEQRVINAYREKVARDMQRDLIMELEAEEKRSQAKDKRKQKRKEREKEKKRQIQQQRETERLARETQARAEEERKKEEAERRAHELEKKRREESVKARKAQEERNRRILEQADKRLEKERMEKQRAVQERLERESKEREARELARREQEARKQLKQQQQQLAKQQKLPKQQAGQQCVAKGKQAAPAPSPLTPSIPATAPVANGMAASSGIPLLDSLQRTPRLEPASPFQMPRPALPAIRHREAQGVSPSMPSFSQMRARANSGPSLQQSAVLSAPIAALPPVPATVDVPPEIDAEIASIVGRVMGSSTLESDLVGGAEWRAGPADGLPKSSGAMFPQACLSAALAAGGPLSAISDQGLRRNSMPMNRLASLDGLTSVDDGYGGRSPPIGDAMADIYAAYCALEKFRCDNGAAPSAGRGHSQHGAYHGAVEIAQIHGRLAPSEVWERCAAFACANATQCSVDPASRTVSFVRAARDASPGIPSAPNPRTAGMPQRSMAHATPSSQLPAISEGGFGMFSLQTPQGGSPLLSGVSAPLNGLEIHPQSGSPMLLSRPPAAPGLTPGRSHMHQPAPAPAQCSSLPSPFEQHQHQHQHQQVGHGFAPAAGQDLPSLYFRSLGMHGPGVPLSMPPLQAPPLRAAVQPLSLPPDHQAAYSMSYAPPFLTPDPWSPAKHAESPGAQPYPPRPLPPQFHPLHALAQMAPAPQPHHQTQQR